MNRSPSVQELRVGVDAIEEGVLRLTGGYHRAVLEVGSVNFALQGEAEQEATLVAYQAFLNGLTFPFHVAMRVLPADFEPYLADVEAKTSGETDERLVELARDHAAFVRRLARSRVMLERRFYAVVPADDPAPPRPRWPFGRRLAAEVDAAGVRRQLAFRCEEVARQLGRCGLAARRLDDLELAQLLHACWCPELARVQRLRRALGDYAALVVRAANPAREGGAPCPS